MSTLHAVTRSNCFGHLKTPLCQCFLLPVKRVTCVEMWLRECLGYGVRAKRASRKGAVDDLQHGTSVEGSSHPCTKGYHSQQGSFYFYLNCHTCAGNWLYMLQTCFLCYSYFYPLQVKNNQELFLGPLAWLVTGMPSEVFSLPAEWKE